MIGIDIMKASVREVSAGAVIVAIMLMVAGCQLPGAEPTSIPATPTPAASPAVTSLPPATVTAASQDVDASAGRGTTPPVRAVATPTPTTIPQHSHKTSACVTGSGAMRRYPSDNARWTIDGTHILFTYGAEVWAVTADGSRLWRVAQAWGQTDPGSRSSFAFGRMTSFDVTPDGQQVVYATCRYPPDLPRDARSSAEWAFRFDYELAAVRLDGQAPRRLTHHPAFDNYPAWSPDGTRIAFVSDGHVSEAEFQRGFRRAPGLHTMTADGADVRRLDTGGTSVAMQPPAWSPDGRSIVVAVWSWNEGREGHELYLVPADGTGFVRLSDAESGGSWSPDGTRLAFAKPEGAGLALYTIAADGADARRVTPVPRWEARYGDQARIHPVAWSPDGAQLLYPCGSRQFCVVTLDGAPVGAPCHGMARGPVCYSRDGRQRVGTSLVGDHAVWSPDGQRIAVATTQDRDARLILYSAAPDGSDVRPLVLAEATRSSSLVGKIAAARLIAVQVRDEDLAASRAACAGGVVVPAPAANPGLVSDCETLLAARAALFGGRLVNWGSGSPLALWMGVTITGTPPRVTGLDLDNERLRGSIPPALANLTQLRQLYLARNRLTGCIPVGLKRVPDNDLGRLGLPDCEAGS